METYGTYTKDKKESRHTSLKIITNTNNKERE